MVSMVNPQPEDAHIRINSEIHREIIKRKFTQRQRDIIDFILTLSWGCGSKPSALIPKLKDFELCGVGKNHIKNELEILESKRVIFWDREMNLFQINKHYDQWEIEIIGKYNKEKMNELISLNLSNRTSNLSKKVPEKGTDFRKTEPEKVPDSGIKFPNKEPESSRKGNSKVPKKGTSRSNKPLRIKRFRLSKTSIKTIIKYTTTTTTRARSPDDYSFGNVFRAYEENFIAGGKVTQFDIDEFSALFDDYGGEWLLKAMREAYRQGPDKRNLAYVHGVLRGYQERGGPESNGTITVSDHSTGAMGAKKTRQQRDLEELDRMREEALQRERVGCY
ncbi:replication protein [Paenibacillus residui]|uniref:Replication protein n=1 Tax=Paenibacillus residui TaxID=629724 RepID=A0ABW3D735_9BACL